MNQINHEGYEVHEEKYQDLRVLCVLRGGNNIFSYDANGNRLNLTENKDTTDEIQTIYTILENSNRLTKVADSYYQYDQNGNIINDGEHTYTYDARNRLIQVASSTLSGVEGSYLYNANNMRVRKTTQTGITLYGWDNDRIFAEYDENGNAVQETVYFGSTPIALLQDNSTYRIYADQIDTPRVITDNQTNQTLWIWTSKPFGESKPNEDVDGDQVAFNYNLRFPGQYYDQETGKHYNFNRDYNPVTGRYVQSDPIGLDGGMNGYGYSNNGPLNKSDFSGHQPSWVRPARRRVDISIDVHTASEKRDAIRLIKAYKGQIYFTVYIYAKDKNWLSELKGAGALVGLHLNPVDTNNPLFGSVKSQINNYFGTYRWPQPVSSIHGSAQNRIGSADMKLLASHKVRFIRAAGDKGTTGGNPPIKLTYSTCHSASAIIRGANIQHYFFHTMSSHDGCKGKVAGTLKRLGFIKKK